MLLLRGEVVTASGGQRVGPPVPSGDEKQNGNENRVRRKEKRYLAVRKTQHPGDARRQVVASSTGQNLDYRAERGLRLLNRPSGIGIQVRHRFCLPHCLHHDYRAAQYEAERRGNARGNRQSRFVPSIESLLDSPKTRLAIACADS